MQAYFGNIAVVAQLYKPHWCTVWGGGRGLYSHTSWEYWGCAAGQVAFFELQALAQGVFFGLPKLAQGAFLSFQL